MNRVLSLLGLGAALALAKVLIVALALALALAAFVSLARWPRETLAFAGVVVLGGLASARPAVALLVVGVVVSVLAITARSRFRQRRREQMLAHLTGPRPGR